MSKLIIGSVGKQKIGLDLGLLLSTRMLVTADSGGGKTFLLKRICEQASSKIQIIIIDPEGEFSPLRERFPFVLAGKGGETPADIRSAQKLAVTLLQTRASAVCDLYEMKASERHEWVRLFLEALLEAPKHLRHPCIVIVDEAHIFCPEKGKGESQASDAMKGLCTRGRKRLLCPLFATQRLAELDKGASGMLNNRLIGPTFEDVNRKRAAEILSVVSEELPEFKKKIQMLEPGYFYALGRAICKERTLLRVGAIETPHGEEARKYELEPPPPPEKIKALLPKLADLPRAAEEEARSAAQFRKEIRELKGQLKQAVAGSRQPEAKAPAPAIYAKEIERLGRESKMALAAAEKQFAAELAARDGVLRKVKDLSIAIHKPLLELTALLKLPLPKPAKIVLPKAPAVSSWGSSGHIQVLPTKAKPAPARAAAVADPEAAKELGKTPLQMLKIIATWHPRYITRAQLAQQAGIQKRGSSMRTYMSKLRTGGYLDEQGETLRLAQAGLDLVGDAIDGVPSTTEEVVALWKPKLGKTPAAMLDFLVQAGGEPVQREALAGSVGVAPYGSSMRTYLSKLRTAGLLVNAGDGHFAANVETLFL